jgi:hypothetical protein
MLSFRLTALQQDGTICDCSFAREMFVSLIKSLNTYLFNAILVLPQLLRYIFSLCARVLLRRHSM